MRKTIISLSIFAVLLAALAYAVPNPVAYNGKQYYIVTSTDQSEDTGAEVCAKVGKTCVGYSAYTTDVCRKFHPDASVTTSVHGSKAGFYCNGPPQTGLACENSYNNCQICPACNVNMDCNTPIGNLFREMYIECAGASPSQSKMKTFYDILKMVQGGVDAEINNKVPGNFKKILGTNLFDVIITTDWLPYYFWLQTKDGNVVDAGIGRLIDPRPNARIMTSTAVIERILNSNDPAAETQNAIKNDEIKIQFFSAGFAGFVSRLGLGALRLGIIPIKPTSGNNLVNKVTDTSGATTNCNVKWDGPKKISCYGPFQALGTGYGQNCCEQDCGADAACDEQAAGALVLNGQCSSECKLDPYQFKPVFPLPNPQSVVDPRIGQHPGNVVCEFYQITKPGDSVKSNHKHVTCAAYKQPDEFCVRVMQSQYARAAKCEEEGIIVCTNPCKPPTYQLPIKQCAYEGERPRGYQSPPLTFCDGAYTGNLGPGNPPQGKKNPGENCQHGGECRTGNCIGVGPPYGQVYQCSCNPFKLVTFGC